MKIYNAHSKLIYHALCPASESLDVFQKMAEHLSSGSVKHHRNKSLDSTSRASCLFGMSFQGLFSACILKALGFGVLTY